MSLFRQITIVGVGLLGGSLAKVAKCRSLADKVVGFGRSQAKLEKAKSLNIIDEYETDLQAAVADADVVVLCSPVSVMTSLVREMVSFLKPGCLVTDVGSVKKPLVGEIQALMPDGTYFVGSHPIAGGEKTGFEASRPDLFQDEKCIVTPTQKTNLDALKKITELWEQVGMQVITMDVEEHDLIFGAVSHLPHVIAYVLMNTIGGISTKNHDEITAFSGKGLKDITRIASSDPVMWRDICLANKKPVLNLIDKFQGTLQQVRNLIENDDSQLLEQTFETAKKYRLNLS
ncbi:Cyclohexadienyl dehydrogenase [hydrothermal vent metagenome]|uniref:Cyclohexadienyl dehydrogenase n=1 Tax=hydrothermal vent metagenome TaxID=652676 RepID=A0A3B1CUQ2_9ZZZZ